MAKSPLTGIPASKIYFGKAATSYDLGRKGNPVTDEDDRIIQEFIDSFAAGSIVADAPCGTGRALEAVISAGHQYRGADISSDMLDECRKKAVLGSVVDLSVADARNLPWADGSCDYLLSFKFLKWVPTDGLVFEILKEYRRVCRGRALINVKLNRDKPDFSFREFRDKLAKLKDKLVLGEAARCFDRATFEAMCKKAGWSIISVQENVPSNGIVYNYLLS